jgi:integrase
LGAAGEFSDAPLTNSLQGTTGGAMSVHKKAKGIYRVVIQIRGRRRDFVVHGSLADAKEEEARLMVELKADRAYLADPKSIPRFADFSLHEYKPYAQIHLRKHTWRRVKYQLALLADHFGDLKLTDIDQSSIQNYKTARLAEGTKATTINTDLRVLARVLSYAKDECGLPVSRIKIRQLPERGQSRATFWSAEQVTTLIAKCVEHSPSIALLVTFIANTGCRKGEALALTWERIDLDRQMVHFWPCEEWQPKNNRPREVTIPDVLVAQLERAGKGAKKTAPIFPCPRTGGHYKWWPQLQFDRARDAAKLTGGPHTLRHTYASMFLAVKADIYLLARVLGHEDVKITMRHYAHLLPDHLEAARNVVQVPIGIGPAELEARVQWEHKKMLTERGIKGGKASGKRRANAALPESLPEPGYPSRKIGGLS